MSEENKSTKIDKLDFNEEIDESDTNSVNIPENNKETEIDELDLDKLIEETEDEIKEDVKETVEEEVSHETESTEKPKKKLPLLLILRILIGIVILVFAVLTIIELRKKPIVKSGFLTIKKKIIWISSAKIQKAEKVQQLKKYNFKLKLAYEFTSIKGLKIFSSELFTKFSSKATIPMDKLYEVIKNNIYNNFKKLTNNKFVEDIPDFKTKISEIIINEVENQLKNLVPDINMKEVKKNINFISFKLS